MERAGFLESLDDALRDQRPICRLVDPLVRFCQLVTRPSVDRLEQHRWREVYAERQTAMSAGIFGPHFEHLCREWTRRFAADEVLGGTPSRVAPAVLSDAKHRQKRQLDVVAIASGHGEQPRVLAIGEAKFTSVPRTMGDVDRLEQMRDLIRATKSNHFAVDDIKLVVFSAEGFDADTQRQRELRDDLVLVDLEGMYAA